jgi:hypothetical protein
MSTPPTLQSADRPTVDEGAARSTQAYTTFVKDLGSRMRENVNFHTMAKDPGARPKMLQAVRNQLIAAVPKFQNLSEADQVQFTERALDQALQPTTGERIQQTVEDVAPVIPPTVAAASGGSIPAVMASGAVGAMLPEVIRPFTTGQTDFMGGLKRAALNAGLVGLGEKAIRGVGSLVGEARRRFVLGTEAESTQTMAARDVLETGLRERGFPLTPKQLVGEHLPPVIGFIENVAESGLGGQGLMRQQRLATDEVIADAALALEQQLATGLRTNEDAANLFLNHAKSRELYARTISSMKHRVVDDLNAQNVKVDAKRLVNLAGSPKNTTTKTLFDHFQLPELRDGQGNTIRRSYKGFDDFLLLMNSASQMGTRRVGFADADRARSALLEIGRDFSGSPTGADKAVGRLANQLAEELRIGMDTAARKLDPKAAQAYASAKEFHKTQVIEKFDDTLYKSIIKAVEKEPGKFARYALSPENIDKLHVLKEMAGDGTMGAWPNIQGKLLQHLVVRAAEKEPMALGLSFDQAVNQGLVKGISGKALQAQVKSLGDEGERLLLEGAPGQVFRRFTNAIEAGSQRPEGPGKIGTVLAQFGAISAIGGAAVGGVLSGGDWAAVAKGAAPGVAILLTPRAFAKLLTNEKMMTNIADGVVGGAKSATFGRLLQNIALLNQEVQKEAGGSFRELMQQAASQSRTAMPNPAGPALSAAPLAQP